MIDCYLLVVLCLLSFVWLGVVARGVCLLFIGVVVCCCCVLFVVHCLLLTCVVCWLLMGARCLHVVVPCV